MGVCSLGRVRLTKEIVEDIVKSDLALSKLAEKYGIDRTYASRIRLGKVKFWLPIIEEIKKAQEQEKLLRSTPLTEREELVYLAGILDGEGAISIASRPPKTVTGGRLYTPYISITNSSPLPLDLLIKHFGGSLTTPHLKQGGGLVRSTLVTSTWTVSNKKAYIFAKVMVHLAKIKKPQLEVVIEYYETLVNSTPGKYSSREAKELRQIKTDNLKLKLLEARRSVTFNK